MYLQGRRRIARVAHSPFALGTAVEYGRRGLGSAIDDTINDLKRLAGLPTVDLSSQPINMQPEGTTSDGNGPAEIDPDIDAQFVNVGGVCMTTDPGTLEVAKDFQRQVNRALKALGAPLIGIDGKIGPQTVTALQKLTQAGVITAPFYGAGSCGDFGTLSNIAAACAAFASSKGISESVSAPAVAQAPAYYNPVTKQVVPQAVTASAMDAFKNLSTIEKVSIVAALGGVGVLLMTAKGRKRK